MTKSEKINGWTFEETIKTAENLMESEQNMFKWDVLRHLRDFAENYREIGTPEECRAAVEKQTAKKIKQQQWMYTRCSCGHDFSKHHGDGYYSIPQEQKTKYCPDCGQKLDWSDEECIGKAIKIVKGGGVNGN